MGKKPASVQAEDTHWCARCEKWILTGDWMLEDPQQRPWHGFHVSQADCDRALPSVERSEVKVVGLERWPRLERVGRLLEAHSFKFARTMPNIPHCYTLARQWENKQELCEVVEEMHLLGEPRNWYRAVYDYLDINEYYYWQMDDRDTPAIATQLINRALRVDYNPPEPPWWPNGPESAIRDIMDTYAPMVGGRSVLDIGCGWPESGSVAGFYQGIGPAGDVARIGALNGIPTTVSYFVPRSPERFDVIVCGAASRLQPQEIERLPLLLAPGGRIVLIFSAAKRWLTGCGPWRPGVWPYKGVAHDHGEQVVLVHG